MPLISAVIWVVMAMNVSALECFCCNDTLRIYMVTWQNNGSLAFTSDILETLLLVYPFMYMWLRELAQGRMNEIAHAQDLAF